MKLSCCSRAGINRKGCDVMKDKDFEALLKIYDYEEKTPKQDWLNGWSWRDVGVHTSTVTTLLTNDYVICTYQSTHFTHYKLTERGKQMAQSVLASNKQDVEQPAIEFNDEMFSDIVGYDNVKELLRECLQLPKPIHILLHGPPSIAKTMFLWAIERAGGTQALWIVGSAASKAGMWDLISERKPRFLLIDEIEKMNISDMAGLLTLMEGGRLVRVKVGRQLDERVDVRVVAVGNRIDALPPELLSRFAVRHLGAYSQPEFVNVVVNVLTHREDIEPISAAQIAQKLVGRTSDVREAIRIARLSTRVGVDRAIELLLG